MRKIISYIAILGLLSLISCQKNPTRLEIIANPTTPSITTPASGFSEVISPSDTLQSLQFQWNAADYGTTDVPINYTIQIDSVGRNFSSPITIATVSSVDTCSIELGSLNKMLYDNFTLSSTDTAVQVSLEARVIATIGLYSKDSLVSNPVVQFDVTTWKKIVKKPVQQFSYLFVAGDFQGWNINDPDSIASIKSNHVYEGYIYAPSGGSYKFYSEVGNWNSTSYGDSGAGMSDSLIVANYAGSNFNFPNTNPGYYLIYANLNTMKWSQILTTWSIIGDATPGGWSTDTPMTYNPGTKVWTVTCDMKTNGSFKFRANNAWVVDFGVDSTGNLAYSDNPNYGYNAKTQNITVPSDGNYTITLDLHKAGAYSYTAVKNN